MHVTTCNKCEKEFIMEPKEELVKEGIPKVYFTCPHCDEEYISHYTNVLVKRKQHEINNVRKDYEKARVKDPYRASKIFNKFQKLKKQIGKEMDKLKKRIEDMD